MKKMSNTNEELLQEFITTRGLSKSTYYSFRNALRHYCNFQEKTLQELLDEAEEEEEQKIRWKKRTLKKRLINYMNYCKENMTLNSAKNYLKLVKIFYHHHEIEIHLTLFISVCHLFLKMVFKFFLNKLKYFIKDTYI